MTRHAKRWIVAAALAVTAATRAVPGAAQQQPQVTFRAGVTLVSVDVTVLDSNGQPVIGLSADDFRITLDGKLQPVKTLAYVTAPGHAVDLPAAGSGAARPRIVSNEPVPDPPALLVLAIDDLSFAGADGRRLLAAARTFVASRAGNTLVGLTTTSGALAVNPTLDRSAIAAALDRIVGSFIDPRRPSGPEAPTIGIAEAIEIASHGNTAVLNSAIKRECAGGEAGYALSHAIGSYNTKCASDVMSSARMISTLTQSTARQQASALMHVLDAMRETAGLKQMIVLTQGMAGTRELVTLFEPMVTAAARSGVQLAILTEDEDDLDLSAQSRFVTALGQSVSGTGVAARRREDRRMFTYALQTLAGMSGASFERVISNADGAFGRAAAAGSGVYRLGVEAPPGAGLRETLTVEATVARPGLTVRVNGRAVAPAPASAAPAASRVAAAIRNGARYDAVPIRMSVARRRAADDRIDLAVDLLMRPRASGRARVTIGVLDSSGRLTQGSENIEAREPGGEQRHTVTVPVKPGAHQVRVAVEDAGGNVGSLSAAVDARLTRIGPFDASDLLMWRKANEGGLQMFALDPMPEGLQALNAGIELYPIAGQPLPKALRILLSITAAGASTPLAEIPLTPAVAGGVHRAQAQLPLAGLPPGSYLIRATVQADGQHLGHVSTTIEKR